MLKTIYGSIQGAIQWWHECCKAMYYLKWKRHDDVDPCLFLKWDNDTSKLILFLLYVDNCLITSGIEEAVNHEAEEFAKLIETTNETPDGIIKEYVGCKVERNRHRICLTQPVKIQRFIDEFRIDDTKKKRPTTPAKLGSVLVVDAKGNNIVDAKAHAQYRSIAGITNHMAQWSRPDIQNAQYEISQFLQAPTEECVEAQERLTRFIVTTKERGYTISPDDPGKLDGTSNYQFVITGESDFEYIKDLSCRSINSGATYLNGALIRIFCKMMPIIALSTTKSELFSAVSNVMDMMFAYHIMISLGFNVKLPMILWVDNTGAVGLANSWSIGGHT